MPKKRDVYEPKSFESDVTILPKTKKKICAKDVSANIYVSMLMSQAWHDLSLKQKELYLYCKAQYYGEKREHTKPKKRHSLWLYY
jgi:hypothetical protein